MSTTLTLHPATITRRLRAAGHNVSTSNTGSGHALVGVGRGTDRRDVRNTLLRLGYDAADSSTRSDVVIVTLPEPVQDVVEPRRMIVADARNATPEVRALAAVVQTIVSAAEDVDDQPEQPDTRRVTGRELVDGAVAYTCGRWQVLDSVVADGPDHFRTTTIDGHGLGRSASLYDVRVCAGCGQLVTVTADRYTTECGGRGEGICDAVADGDRAASDSHCYVLDLVAGR